MDSGDLPPLVSLVRSRELKLGALLHGIYAGYSSYQGLIQGHNIGRTFTYIQLFLQFRLSLFQDLSKLLDLITTKAAHFLLRP